MGKSTISMAIFNSYVSLPEGNSYHLDPSKMAKGNPRFLWKFFWLGKSWVTEKNGGYFNSWGQQKGVIVQ